MTARRCVALILALMMTVPTFTMLVPIPPEHVVTAAGEPPTVPTDGRASRPVIRNWSVVLSFEYNPSKNQVIDMMGGLKLASHFLYNASLGQFRYKHADIWTNGKNFTDVKTQIQVHDVGVNYRANAVRGGIDMQGATVNLGMTDFGMLWNASWGGMTIAHEWSHYGLYLPDQYEDKIVGGYLVSIPWQDDCMMGNNSDPVRNARYETIDTFNKTNPNAEAQSCWEQIKSHFSSAYMPPTAAAIAADGPHAYAAKDEMDFTIHFPSLYISPSDITMTPSSPAPKEGDKVTLSATVHNKEAILNGNVIEVWFYDGPVKDGKVLATKTISISGQPTDVVTTTWTATGGYHNIYVVVDPNDTVLEWDNYDKRTSNQTVHVLAKPVISKLVKDKVVDENQVISMNLSAMGTDVETAQKDLRWSVGPSDYDPSFVANISGQNNQSQVLDITPVKYKFGKTSITLTLTDKDGMWSSKTINLTWNWVDQAPVIGAINLGQQWTYRTTPVDIYFTGFDPDEHDTPTTLTSTIQVKPSAETSWSMLASKFDGAVWRASFTPARDAKRGSYDIMAKLFDVNSTTGTYYLNNTLQVLDSPPVVTAITPASTTAYRGTPLNLTVAGGDAEEDGGELKVDLEYQPFTSEAWLHGGSFNHWTGKYNSGNWTVPLLVGADTKVGNCDLRVRLNDSIGPGPWRYLNKTMTVTNAPPVVSKFIADSADVLRVRTVNLTIQGSDFETPSDKLVLRLEYVIGGSTDWEPLPSAQAKVTYDAKLKLWNVVYTPTKDNYLGIYHIRASLKDLDNTNGPTGDLQGNLLIKNNPPKVKFTAKTSVTTGEVVTFDARDTTDPEDSVSYLKFDWDFKDGKATSSRVSHAFNNPGTYEVTVKVTDRDGGVSTAKTTVTVTKGSVLGPGGGLGLAIIAGVVVVVVVVVVIMVLVLRKKQKGPFKKRK